MSAYQGQEIPYCYGFYNFDLPSGDKAIGVLLEDLTEACRSINYVFSRPGVVESLTFGKTKALVSPSLFISIWFVHLKASHDPDLRVLPTRQDHALSERRRGHSPRRNRHPHAQELDARVRPSHFTRLLALLHRRVRERGRPRVPGILRVRGVKNADPDDTEE